MPDEKKLVSHYELKTLLRRDGFGAVFLGQDTRNGKQYALRTIELDGPALARITGRMHTRSQRDHPLIEQIRRRMRLISELKHSHILPVIEFGEEHRQDKNALIFYMVSPYERESLLSYWSSRTSSSERISLEIIADLIFQAGEALLYVHKRGLIHQYVRLSSFLFRSQASRKRHLLLTDFWFADITPALLEDGQIEQKRSRYFAPEQLSGRVLPASDQYTLALLAYELLLGHRLSQDDLPPGLYEHELRQRSAGLSAAELELAHRLDLVLARALAEQATARFANIEEFVCTFRAVAHGEAIDLSGEETLKLPVVGEKGDRGQGEAPVAGTAGTPAAGASAEVRALGDITAEMLAAARLDEQAHPEHRHSLHRTTLISQDTQTVTGELLEEARAQPSAGLATDEALPSEADLAEDRARVIEENTLTARGAITQLASANAADAGMVGVGVGLLESTQAAGTSAGLATVGGAGVARRRRCPNSLLAVIVFVLLLALIGSGLLVFASNQATATVTLTLQSRTIQNTYLVTTTTGTTGQGQVQANSLTQTVSRSTTGHASGYFPGAEASGFLTFHNTSIGCGCPSFIPAGTPFISSTGVTVVIDYGISVAAQLAVTVPAHAMIYGPGGDIPAGSIHATFGARVLGTNRFAFTGGQGGQSNALVQQSDIDGLAATLQAHNEQDALIGLEAQLKTDQDLAGTPFCQSKTSADHPAGSAATSVTVTVKTTCTAEAYDYTGMVQVVQQDMQTQATSYFSSDFVEVGTPHTTVVNAVTDARGGTLLAVRAVGRWAYRSSKGLKQSLAKSIAGLDVNHARTLLGNENGIAAVNDISIAGPNQHLLPADDSKITIVLRD